MEKVLIIRTTTDKTDFAQFLPVVRPLARCDWGFIDKPGYIQNLNQLKKCIMWFAFILNFCVTSKPLDVAHALKYELTQHVIMKTYFCYFCIL